MRDRKHCGFPYLSILLLWVCFVSPTRARELILFVDDSGSVKGFNWLKTQLERVGETLLNNGDVDQISIVPIGDSRAPSPLRIPTIDVLAGQLASLAFDARYTRIAEALTSGFGALAPEESDLVVILSDFTPDHDNRRPFNRDDYQDLKDSLGILLEQIGKGTNVRPILLGGQRTSPGDPWSGLQGREELQNALESLSQDPSRCLALSGGNCTGLNRFLSWAVAFNASKGSQQQLSYLDRTAAFESVLQTILSDWLERPFTSSPNETISIKAAPRSPPKGRFLRTAIDLTDIPITFQRYLDRELEPLEKDIDEYSRHIDFDISSGRSNFGGNHFVVVLQGIGTSEYEAEARLYWYGANQEELLVTRSFMDTDESSLYFAFNDFLNRELTTWVAKKVPAPERPARVVLKYPGDLGREEVAPGFEVRVTSPATDRRNLSSAYPSNQYGLADVEGIVTRDDYFFEVYDVDSDQGTSPIHRVPMAKGFWKILDQSVGQKILLPYHQITLQPATGEGDVAGLVYKASIDKAGFHYWGASGVEVAAGGVTKRIPPGKFRLRAVPKNTDYLESWSNIQVTGDTMVEVGSFTNEGPRFLKDKFKILYKDDKSLSLRNPLVQKLFEGVEDVQSPNFSSLRAQTKENWRHSPYVFHVVNRLIYHNRGCLIPTGELCSPQGLRRFINLYDSFAQEEGIGSSRREGDEATVLSQLVIDYLVLLWKNVLAPTTRDLLDLRLFLDGRNLDLPLIAEGARAFLVVELKSEKFEPLTNSGVELRQLLCSRDMAWGSSCQ